MARNKKQEGNMKGFVKRKVVILALGASFIVGNNISFAGESKDEYVFDPIIVATDVHDAVREIRQALDMFVH